MKVTSTGIKNGVIDDRFGKRGEQMDKHGIPTRSLPLKIEDVPAGTVSCAIVMEDKDAVPVCGFSWVHWVAANIKKTELAENESLEATDFVQGTTSWFGVIGEVSGIERLEVSRYGGPTPPNAPHLYEIHVFALDCELELEKGFFMNELYHAMKGHVLEQYTLTGTYAD